MDHVASSGERARSKDQYKVVEPSKVRGSDTVLTEEHFDGTVEKGNMTRQSSEPDVDQWSSWLSWTWSLSSKVFMVGFFVIANMAAITITNHF